YQNIPPLDFLMTITGANPPAPPEFYADTAVIAFPAPGSDVPDAELRPKVTASGGNLDATVLAGGDFTKIAALPKAPVGQQAWVQFEFAKPQAIRALTFALGGPVNPFQDIVGGAAPGPDLEASEDGVSFRKVSAIPNDGAQVHTISFEETTARFFRVSFTTPPPFT